MIWRRLWKMFSIYLKNNMEKVKMLIACHKSYDVFQDSVYTPIQVGKRLHPELNLGYITDDTGDNISIDNQRYCELTAQYWGWKNLNSEYIGLCHYRRFFSEKFTYDNIDDIMNGYDVILAKPIYGKISRIEGYIKTFLFEDLYVFISVVKILYPEYYNTLEKAMFSNVSHPFNMFVMRNDVFKKFTEWEFNILKTVDEIVLTSPYTRLRRLMGFLGEILLPIFCIHNNLKIKEMPVVDSIQNQKEVSSYHGQKKMINNMVFRLTNKFRNKSFYFMNYSDILVGLKQDGIIDKLGKLKEKV